MIFHKSVYDDIKRYYTNTIIKLPQLSEDRLWQISTITPTEIKLVDVDGIEIYMDLNEEYVVEYPLPGRVVYQSGTNAYLLFRKPAKQYYRGLHKENTAISRYNDDGSCSATHWSLQSLQQFVDKPAYQDIHTIDFENGYSWALSPYMAVSINGYVNVLNKVIALADFKAKTVKVLSSMFKPEVAKNFPGYELL